MGKDERELERQEEREVSISDRRHSRDVDEESEVEEPQAAPAEVPPPAEAVGEEPPVDADSLAPGAPVAGEPEAPAEPAGPAPDVPAVEEVEDSPEVTQLRMLFEAGIVGYLHGQLDLLLTFALIYLGRRPNPATGLVATDLEKARLVIDLLEFIFARTQQELSQQDRAGLANLLSGLKMEYAQAAQGAPEKPPTDEGEA